ncbi:VC0807 family protein [Spelaeicoccus albus]|uniref:VC0807 family protein n=1 Tax=Spelaeicoccus albus TaxID=1280376 RepID=UPI0024734627|nr:VC0807 family protein [Spelaeicoccus albus]
MVFDLVVPLTLFYVLRGAGVSIYLALLAGALASGITAVVVVATQHRLDGIAVFVMSTMLLSVGVSLLTGSTRFLLAKEGWLTAVTGVWFLGSLRARRPLAYQFSRPLLEGRLGWPADWDAAWERAPRFRRMWQISTVLWGLGTLLDSAARVVMAYTLPVDVVPAISAAMYAITSAVLIVVTNVYYRAAGAYNPTSALYHPKPARLKRTDEIGGLDV